MLDFVNAILVNLSIIVSMSLTLYFLSIRQSLKDSQFEQEFIYQSGRLSLTKKHQMVLGIIVGIICFFISLNKIPIQLFGVQTVDVRYLPIFFSIYYGSTLIGVFNGGTLIVLKLIQYSIRGAYAYEYFNNIFLTLSLLLLAAVIKEKKFTPKRAVLTFLIVALAIRIGTFSIIFYPLWKLENFVNLLAYIAIFSSVFLFTAWLIDSSISISKRIHVYKSSSIHDQLTNLYNKESFYFFLDDVYNEFMINQKSCGVAVLDIDNFKAINDNYGHLAGDAVLIHVAKTLIKDKSPLESPKICRIGGDEFAMVFKSPLEHPNDFIQKKIKEINDTPVHYEEHTIHVEVSCGLSIIKKHPSKKQPLHAEDLFKLADDTLYQAKRSGKNQAITTIHEL